MTWPPLLVALAIVPSAVTREVTIPAGLYSETTVPLVAGEEFPYRFEVVAPAGAAVEFSVHTYNGTKQHPHAGGQVVAFEEIPQVTRHNGTVRAPFASNYSIYFKNANGQPVVLNFTYGIDRDLPLKPKGTPSIEGAALAAAGAAAAALLVARRRLRP